MDYSPPGSSVHSGILQARILKWVSISSSRGSSRPRDWTQVSCTAGSFFTIWATREAPFFGLFQFPHALNLGTNGGQLNKQAFILFKLFNSPLRQVLRNLGSLFCFQEKKELGLWIAKGGKTATEQNLGPRSGRQQPTRLSQIFLNRRVT